MKKILSFTLALLATCTMAYAATQSKSATVDCGDQVQMTATPATGWHFVKWSDEVTTNPRTYQPTKDTTFKAIFEINKYIILFQNWDMTELQKDTLNHGAAVSYKGNTPTKDATAQYTFTFAGWNPTISTPATDNATYTAQFDTTINKYNISFLNWDSTLLEKKAWDYGSTPSYAGTPSRPSDDSCSYTFKGWDRTIETVTHDTVYVAQYNATKLSYTITVNGENGSTTGSGTYQYGQTVTITATPNACYKFVKWNDGDTNASREITVTGTKTYTATFEKIQYKVTVESDDDAQGTADVVKL